MKAMIIIYLSVKRAIRFLGIKIEHHNIKTFLKPLPRDVYLNKNYKFTVKNAYIFARVMQVYRDTGLFEVSLLIFG